MARIIYSRGNIMNQLIEDMGFGARISPIHPNMTDYTSNGWSLTYSATYSSRIVAGQLWYLFKASTASSCELYVDNSTWLVTLTAPTTGIYFFTGFSKMVFASGDSYYRNGTGCTVTTYNGATQTSSNTYVYLNGFSIAAVPFTTITLTGFYGGYQADDLVHDVGIAYLNGYNIR